MQRHPAETVLEEPLEAPNESLRLGGNSLVVARADVQAEELVQCCAIGRERDLHALALCLLDAAANLGLGEAGLHRRRVGIQ